MKSALWQQILIFWGDKPAWSRASVWFLLGLLFMGFLK